jgi:hypothetical protein
MGNPIQIGQPLVFYRKTRVYRNVLYCNRCGFAHSSHFADLTATRLSDCISEKVLYPFEFQLTIEAPTVVEDWLRTSLECLASDVAWSPYDISPVPS